MAAVLLELIENRLNRRNFRRERLFRDRHNPLEVYDDVEMYTKFRFRRCDILDLVRELTPSLEHRLARKGALPPLLQVLIGIRYLASGAFQDQTGELCNVSQPTVSRIVTRVVNAIIRHGSPSICLPTQREANLQKIKFFEVAGMPEVIGCIDGTHVRIMAPHDNEHEFVNRKNYHSINVQIICNADRKIINCIAKWPGSVHDSRILRMSPLFRDFEQQNKPLNGIFLELAILQTDDRLAPSVTDPVQWWRKGRCGQVMILNSQKVWGSDNGDSGYMIRTWLMTPYGHPNGENEARYNVAHAQTRVKVENCIGVLKRRWACLNSLRLEPHKACRVIFACAILHNRANRLGLQEPENEPLAAEIQVQGGDAICINATDRVRTLAGQAVRNRIMENLR